MTKKLKTLCTELSFKNLQSCMHGNTKNSGHERDVEDDGPRIENIPNTICAVPEATRKQK